MRGVATWRAVVLLAVFLAALGLVGRRYMMPTTGWDVGPAYAGSPATTPLSGAPVTSLAFSPDGSELAIARQDGEIVVWQVSPARARLRLQEPGAGPTFAHGPFTFPSRRLVSVAVAYCPHGKTLATGGVGRSVRLRDAATGLVRRTLVLAPPEDAIAHSVFSLACNAEGTTLAVGHRYHLAANCIISCPGGQRLDIYSSGNIYLYDVPTQTLSPWSRDRGGSWRVSYRGRELLVEPGDPDNGAVVAESHTGQVAAMAATDGVITVLRGAGNRIVDAVCYGAPVSALAITADGRRVAAGSEDGRVRIWEIP